MAHAPTAKELIRRLPQPHRDSALFEIAEFILRKRPLSDPYEPHAQGYNVDFEAVLDITEIIREIEKDGYVYLFIESIAETIGSSRLRDRFTRQQRANIVSRLEEIAAAKFPDLKNIRHEGYKIAAEAQIARIRQATSQEW
jgi:Pyruvate/2-oxoacid:ferredoxin oxidoreductase gamma subunit